MTKTVELYKILASISSHFIGDFVIDDSINKSFQELGLLTDADRVYLYRIHHKAKLAHITYEWLNTAAPDIPASMTSFSLSDFNWLISELNTRDIILIGDLKDLPSKAAAEKTTLRKQKVRSFIAFPLRIKEKLEGFVGFDSMGDAFDLPVEILEMIRIATDIIGFSLERKMSEKSLRKTERLYENIFENTGAATVTIRPDTGITMVNSEFERLFGYPRKKVEGKVKLIDLVREKDQSLLKRYHHLMMSSPDTVPKNYEFEYITSKGNIRSAYMTGSSLLDTKNCVISFIDITDFKETERQLIIARDRAEESDRLKSAFLANVSHEIRTPLNAITGFSALLANPNLHLDKKEKYIKQILNGSSELANLIDNVLDISGIESRTLQPKITEFFLNAMLEETFEFYKDYKLQHAKNSIDIRLKIPKDMGTLAVKTDKIRLQQILANILENAIKFTKSGFIEFGYSILNEEEIGSDRQSLMFFVKDSGIGIAKKDKEKIFERFVKIVNKEDRLYRGAGLGLALAKDLTHLLGGEIWVESRLGKGSTFYFTIPYELPEVDKPAAKTPSGKSNRNWSDKTIMVAEDTESNYMYIEEILGVTGARLIRARDGLQAIEVFRSKKDEIDIILMDILMPEYDGYEATQQIRKIRKDIPVIAQTAFTFEGELTDGLYAGCFNDYILKPFNIKAIHELLEKYLFKD